MLTNNNNDPDETDNTGENIYCSAEEWEFFFVSHSQNKSSMSVLIHYHKSIKSTRVISPTNELASITWTQGHKMGF